MKAFQLSIHLISWYEYINPARHKPVKPLYIVAEGTMSVDERG
jgi:hypothetical protein